MITDTGRDQLTYTLHQGDCLDVLATLDPESVDCVVEDPPAGIGFMGKPWDSYRTYQPRTQKGRSTLRLLGLSGLAQWESGFVTFIMEAHVATARVMKPGAYMLTWALPKTADLAGLALRLAGLEVCDSVLHLFGSGMSKAGDLGKKIDATPEAERWAGWSSQLAPGHEQWLLARKPSRLTYAQQVLTHGCGALNVGACRVPRGEDDQAAMRVPQRATYGMASGLGRNGERFKPDPSGSLPKNVVLTLGGPWCPGAELDRQSGITTSGVVLPHHVAKARTNLAKGQEAKRVGETRGHGDTGGASRYFTQFRYQAKARDRDVPGDPEAKNRHPTHKHPELMRWLVRLVCPPGGRVLDPFAGSGTTGVAAAAEGCHFVGVEQDLDSFQVAQARVAYAYQASDPEAYSPKRAGRKRART